jgi:inorganic pyrophosphatase
MLPAFRSDGSINVVIESPRGSAVKFKYDSADNVIVLSRPLPIGLIYPYDWGIVPSTRGPDGDPLDAMIVWDGTGYPGVVIPCRPLGALTVEQTSAESKRTERNDRFVMAPVKAPRQADITSVFDLSDRVRGELEEFFLHAAAFEGKALRILGWEGPDAVIRQIRRVATKNDKRRKTRSSR